MTKTCLSCEIEKPLEEFAIKKNGKFGRKPRCKKCTNAEYAANCEEIQAERKEVHKERMKDPEYERAYRNMCNQSYQRNKETRKRYIKRIRESINAARRRDYPKNREKLCAIQKERRRKNGDKMKARRQELRLLNLEKIRQREREYSRKRRANDIQYRLVGNLRNRIRLSLENKSECTKDLLGCSLGDFIKHLESQFAVEMNWGNYGGYWEIDHIKPCCSFDLTDPVQQRACFHWSNCRPLTAVENKWKSAEDKKSKIKIGNAA